MYGYAVLSLLAHVSMHGSYYRVLADPMFHSSTLIITIHLTDTKLYIIILIYKFYIKIIYIENLYKYI